VLKKETGGNYQKALLAWATGVDPTNGYEPSADQEEDVNRLLATIPHIRVSRLYDQRRLQR
jgi:hypothetical protein